jgi:hypothetical protein
MNRWFRFYEETLNDPKILKLSDNLYRIWVGILCAASKNDGILPPPDDLALLLRIKPEKIQDAIKVLMERELIDDDGGKLQPHNWHGRQYKSDVSTERVKRFRKRRATVSVTSPDSETDSDSDSETDRKKDAAPSGAQVISIVASPEKIYFDQAAHYLDPGGRSLAAALLKSKDGNIPAAHAALLTAIQKSNPRGYIGAIINGRDERLWRPDRSF